MEKIIRNCNRCPFNNNYKCDKNGKDTEDNRIPNHCPMISERSKWVGDTLYAWG